MRRLADVSSPSGPLGGVSPVVNGFSGWSGDMAGSGANTAMTSGTVALAALWLPTGAACSTLWWYTKTAGAGLTAGECYAGVCDPTGKMLALSGDLSASNVFTATGAHSLNLGAFTLGAGLGGYALLLANGATAPVIAGFSASGQGPINLGPAAVVRFGALAGQTSLPAVGQTIALASFSQAVPLAIGVS